MPSGEVAAWPSAAQVARPARGRLIGDRLVGAGLAVMAVFLPVSITGTQVGLALAAAGALMSVACGRAVPRTPLDEPILALLAVTLVSGLASEEPTSALRRFAGSWVILPLYLVPGWLGTTERVERFLGMLSVSAVALGAYGILQHFTGWNILRGGAESLHTFSMGDRTVFLPRGGFSHYQTYANVFYLLFCLCFGLAVGSRGAGARFRRGAVAALLAAVLLFTLTRGIWLAAVVGLAIFALVLARRPARATAAILLGGAVLLVALAPGVLRTRARSIGEAERNVERLLLWETTWNMLRDHPILGVGVGNYRRAQDGYIREAVPITMTRTHAHNVWLQVAVERGMLGLLAFLWLTAALAREAAGAVRRSRAGGGMPLALAAGGAAALAGFYVDGLVQDNFGDGQVAMLLWLVVGIVLVCGRGGEPVGACAPGAERAA